MVAAFAQGGYFEDRGGSLLCDQGGSRLHDHFHQSRPVAPRIRRALGMGPSALGSVGQVALRFPPPGLVPASLSARFYSHRPALVVGMKPRNGVVPDSAYTNWQSGRCGQAGPWGDVEPAPDLGQDLGARVVEGERRATSAAHAAACSLSQPATRPGHGARTPIPLVHQDFLDSRNF